MWDYFLYFIMTFSPIFLNKIIRCDFLSLLIKKDKKLIYKFFIENNICNYNNDNNSTCFYH